MVGDDGRGTRGLPRVWGVLGVFLVMAGIIGVGVDPGWGAGFALTQQGTAAMAQGNAFVAEANDPSAIFYNPAGLTQLNKFAFYSGTVFNYPSRWYEGDRGYESETHHRYYHTAQVFASLPLKERAVLGLGFFTPFGLGTAWPPDWAGRYVTTWSKLKTYELNPTLAIKILDNLSIGGGVRFLWSDVQLKRKIPVIFHGFQLPDAESDLHGKGNGVGGSFGILYEPVKGVKLGASYRSQIHVTHEGNLVISRLPFFLPLPRNAQGSAGLTYPATVQFGVSVNRFAPLTVNLDATWTQWSAYERLSVALERPMFISGRFTNIITNEKNWVDTWAFRLGANYKLMESMILRAGYAYDMTPVPRSSFEPQLPDGNRHIFAVGGDLKVWKLNLAIAYNYILFEGRTKNNYFATNGVPLPPAWQANGKYGANTHSLGLSSTFYW